jgi:hypothetical protein
MSLTCQLENKKHRLKTYNVIFYEISMCSTMSKKFQNLSLQPDHPRYQMPAWAHNFPFTAAFQCNAETKWKEKYSNVAAYLV